jgi:hypothetical protein
MSEHDEEIPQTPKTKQKQKKIENKRKKLFFEN